MTKARLVVLLIAPGQWFLVWALRYWAVVQIPPQVKAIVAAFAGAIAVLGTWFAQGRLYYAMTGIGIPAQDNYFFAVVLGESLVSLGIVFLLAFELRKKASRRNH
jgi:hypothetical protein